LPKPAAPKKLIYPIFFLLAQMPFAEHFHFLPYFISVFGPSSPPGLASHLAHLLTCLQPPDQSTTSLPPDWSRRRAAPVCHPPMLWRWAAWHPTSSLKMVVGLCPLPTHGKHWKIHSHRWPDYSSPTPGLTASPLQFQFFSLQTRSHPAPTDVIIQLHRQPDSITPLSNSAQGEVFGEILFVSSLPRLASSLGTSHSAQLRQASAAFQPLAYHGSEGAWSIDHKPSPLNYPYKNNSRNPENPRTLHQDLYHFYEFNFSP
jgi:hypothetical protein